MSLDPISSPAPADHAAPGERAPRVVLLSSVLYTLPIWLTRFPQMVDYPQHLAMAAIVRFYHDPARRFFEIYTLAFSRPNTLFELVVAALSFVLPIDLAGRLVVALAVAAVGPAALALARRAGRPDWYALVALAGAYNFAYYWGFVGNVIAAPFLIYGIVVVDRVLDRPLAPRGWLILCAYTIAFYFMHLQ